ncbi:hypothetical protein CB0940_02884 [Cercospora beticola]|uniref:Uncharacterized protein n=1 Tax=Cercospora beticola TaxID=122368 RepID=A0A2G5I387_CERBT|nr:hypothetical protein CB0940_02884 [Cercospora beticola]PIA99259.1 hypothetical protein CB0940_02884 [Cercospora beticola]WPB00037.1 hypothetical protein RHO25_004656 [Cercospora beticola]CAK1361785.1 unnamed protein product [Cercospora beticola]
MFPIPAFGPMIPAPGLLEQVQFRGRQAYDGHRAMLAVRPHSLADILPAVYEERERLQYDAEMLIDRFVSECPEVYPRCRFNPLREEEVREVYYITLRELSRSSIGSASFDVTSIWQRRLERLIEVDRTDVRVANRFFFHRRSNHLFRALAELSYVNQSARIGHVLYSFFVRHASQIVAVETSATIGQWCNAILRATMTETQRAECFRRVYELRPDLPQSLRRHGRRGQLVAECIERLSVGISAERRTIGLDRPRLGLRSSSAGLLGDDLSLNGLGGRRSPFRRTGLMSGGLIGNELDDLTDDMYGLRSSEHRIQDDLTNQRLLELSMGPRYASRFSDPRSADDMSLLTMGDGIDDIFGELDGSSGLYIDDGLDLHGI